jgi:putative FmdB family regulatory protein
MPIYEYACQKCGKKTEAIQRMGEKTLKICPHCGGTDLKKLASAPAIQFKGSGFYKTDYPSATMESGKAESASSGKSDSGEKAEKRESSEKAEKRESSEKAEKRESSEKAEKRESSEKAEKRDSAEKAEKAADKPPAKPAEKKKEKKGKD